MSKIICDVCGTSYPETATQCPICGCVRSSDSVTVAGDTGDMVAQKPASYAYVKGGRFSKSNVKKRNAGIPLTNVEPQKKSQPRPGNAKPAAPAQGGNQQRSSAARAAGQGAMAQANRPKPPVRRDAGKKNGKKYETGLVIAIIVLLLAIAGIVIYIACSYLGLVGNKPDQDSTNPTQQVQDDSSTDPTGNATVEITSLKLSATSAELKSLGASVLLNVVTEPAGQKFDVKFESDDSDIATVEKTGDNTCKVVATGRGVATITATCGKFTAKCVVTCNFEVNNGNNGNNSGNNNGGNNGGNNNGGNNGGNNNVNTEPVYEKSDLTFNDFDTGYYDVTFPMNWVSVQLYTGKIPADKVTFASNDEKVATVDEEGKVTFVGPGRALITATYGEWSITFIVRVSE